MQTVSELMTRNVQFVAPQDSLQRAAQLMDELNVGALPVCDHGKLVGMVTDRDITVRGTAAGRRPQEAHVDEVMSGSVRWCFEDQPLDDVMIQMADSQVRRIPVVSHDDEHRLVGIISLGDVVTKATGGTRADDAEQMVETISSPSQPDRPGEGSKQATRPPTDVAGRRGSVPADASVGHPDTARRAGVPMSDAGETGSGLGHGEVAGASGLSKGGGAGAERTGATGDPRRNFGVGGQDLQQDGLPRK